MSATMATTDDTAASLQVSILFVGLFVFKITREVCGQILMKFSGNVNTGIRDS